MFYLKKKFKNTTTNLDIFLLKQNKNLIGTKAIATPFLFADAVWAIPPSASQQEAVVPSAALPAPPMAACPPHSWDPHAAAAPACPKDAKNTAPPDRAQEIPG